MGDTGQNHSVKVVLAEAEEVGPASCCSSVCLRFKLLHRVVNGFEFQLDHFCLSGGRAWWREA